MKGMRSRATALAALLLACIADDVRGFAVVPAQVPHLRPTAARVRPAGGVVSLQAIFDKVAKAALSNIGRAAAAAPLPTSPRLKDFDGGEIQESLERFVKSTPEGLLRSGQALNEKVLPLAKDLLFKDFKDKKDGDDAGAGKGPAQTVETVESENARPVQPTSAAALAGVSPPDTTATASAPVAAASQTPRAPDSRSEVKDLQRLLDSSVSDSMPSPEEGMGKSNARASPRSVLPWDEDEDEQDDGAPAWMLDSKSFRQP